MGTLLGSLDVTLGTLTPGQCFTRRGRGVPLGILGSLEVTLRILASAGICLLTGGEGLPARFRVFRVTPPPPININPPSWSHWDPQNHYATQGPPPFLATSTPRLLVV